MVQIKALQRRGRITLDHDPAFFAEREVPAYLLLFGYDANKLFQQGVQFVPTRDQASLKLRSRIGMAFKILAEIASCRAKDPARLRIHKRIDAAAACIVYHAASPADPEHRLQPRQLSFMEKCVIADRIHGMRIERIHFRGLHDQLFKNKGKLTADPVPDFLGALIIHRDDLDAVPAKIIDRLYNARSMAIKKREKTFFLLSGNKRDQFTLVVFLKYRICLFLILKDLRGARSIQHRVIIIQFMPSNEVSFFFIF